MIYMDTITCSVYLYHETSHRQLIIIEGDSGINSVLKDTIIEELDLFGYVNIFPTQIFMVETSDGPRLSSHLPIYQLTEHTLILYLNTSITQYRVEAFIDTLLDTFGHCYIHIIGNTLNTTEQSDTLVSLYSDTFVREHSDETKNIRYGYLFAGIGSELLLAMNPRGIYGSLSILFARSRYNSDIAELIYNADDISRYGDMLLDEIERLVSIVSEFQFTKKTREYLLVIRDRMISDINIKIQETKHEEDFLE